MPVPEISNQILLKTPPSAPLTSSPAANFMSVCILVIVQVLEEGQALGALRS